MIRADETTTPDDMEERVTALMAQIDQLLAHNEAPGRLPPYLTPSHSAVRDAIVERYTQAGWRVWCGFDADQGSWIVIKDPSDDPDGDRLSGSHEAVDGEARQAGDA